MRNEYIPVRKFRSTSALGMNASRSGKRFGRLSDAFKQDAAYWGKKGDWYIVAARHRDSDTLDESNFTVLLELLGGESDNVAMERANHFLVGWLDYLIIHPHNRAGLRLAILAHSSVSNYPVLNEEHFSNLEYEKFWDYAKRELQQFDGWEAVLVNETEDDSPYGDESAESDCIERVRARLEELAPLYEAHASSPIDPRQNPLFPNCPVNNYNP